MTALADLSGLTLTATAKVAGQRQAVDLAGLVTQAKLLLIELQKLLATIESLHPSSGVDATNYAQLATIAGELA